MGSTLSSKNCCAAANPARNVTAAASLPLLAHAELVASTDHLSVVHHDLEHLLALHLVPGLVLQRSHNLLGACVDDLSGGRVRLAAVDAERNPAGKIAQLDRGPLFGWHYGGIEDVQAVVGSVGQPEFLFIVRQSDAVAG